MCVGGVERVMTDRKISGKLKGKVLMCVTSAYLYGLEMVALIERQQQRLWVCENNWVSGIVGGRGWMDELREEIGVEISLIGILGKS